MRWTSATLAGATALLAGAATGVETTVYRDSETGFTFSQYSAQYIIGRTIAYRVAVPSPVTYGTPYDVVVQVVAPNDVGWAGLAWGGRMTNNPLTVAWANGYSAVTVSSRFAPDHTKAPPPYSGASYEVFRTGTRVNGTHWQYTAKCTGCSLYISGGSQRTLDPSGGNRLAWAYASARPVNPSSNLSSFTVHDAFNSWTHDFASAGNTGFSSLVAKNMGR